MVDPLLVEEPTDEDAFRVTPQAADESDLGPSAASIVATLAAPPSRCSRLSARRSGTGASWLIRSASPQM